MIIIAGFKVGYNLLEANWGDLGRQDEITFQHSELNRYDIS